VEPSGNSEEGQDPGCAIGSGPYCSFYESRMSPPLARHGARHSSDCAC
jgi:hypothetical protein